MLLPAARIFHPRPSGRGIQMRFFIKQRKYIFRPRPAEPQIEINEAFFNVLTQAMIVVSLRQENLKSQIH
jgi:hypothetical protein